MSSQPRRPNPQVTGSGADAEKLSLTRPVQSVSTLIRPGLPNFLDYEKTPLHPLVSSANGEQHPNFPRNLAAFHLLTKEQLADLARFYHQNYPRVKESDWYPGPVQPWIGAQYEPYYDDLEEVQRYRFGWFIGLYTPANPQPLPNPFKYQPKFDLGESFLRGEQPQFYGCL